jgi:hypothetical protein
MHIPRKYIWGAAAVTLLGACVAQAATAELHTMQASAPDGAVVEVHYAGDVAPQVQFVRADAEQAVAADPFLEMERISAAMDAQMQAMMQRAALMQQQAVQVQQAAARSGEAAAAPASGLTMVGNMPQGVHVTYYSSTTDAKGCTHSVSYSSQGGEAEPKVTQAASDGCDTAAPGPSVIQAKAQTPAAPARPAGNEI